jgi:uncharacterized membrane protein
VTCARSGASFVLPLGLHPRGIIQLGLVLLIATPVARVAFSVFAVCCGARPYVCGFTLMVLGI